MREETGAVLALFSLTEVPLVRSVSFDPDVLVKVSGADRIGGLRSVNVREVDVLHDLRPAQAEAVMEAVGAMLKDSLARRVCLWLAHILADSQYTQQQ